MISVGQKGEDRQADSKKDYLHTHNEHPLSTFFGIGNTSFNGYLPETHAAQQGFLLNWVRKKRSPLVELTITGKRDLPGVYLLGNISFLQADGFDVFSAGPMVENTGLSRSQLFMTRYE